jgi:hypothetical protein
LATRTRGRLLLAVLLLGGAVAYFGIGEVIEWAEEVVDDVFGASYLTAPEGKRRTEKLHEPQGPNAHAARGQRVGRISGGPAGF